MKEICRIQGYKKESDELKFCERIGNNIKQMRAHKWDYSMSWVPPFLVMNFFISSTIVWKSLRILSVLVLSSSVGSSSYYLKDESSYISLCLMWVLMYFREL